MAEKLDPKELVSLEELMMRNSYTQEALINLHKAKGIFKKNELLAKKRKLKIIHQPLIQDITRYRDWPIKVLTFTSVFYFGLMGSFLIYEIEIPDLWIAIALIITLALLWGWTILCFVKCHLKYLEARNIQVNIQKKLELDQLLVDNKKIFPHDWFHYRPIKLSTGFWGWGFYVLYATILFVLSLFVVWGLFIS